MQGNKYDVWLTAKEMPEEMSIIEVSVLAGKLGIDVDEIKKKNAAALFGELVAAIRAAWADEKCPLCEGTKEGIQRPARLMGATYPEDDQFKGDEHLEPCPLCC